MSDKIQARHLERLAYIYVRQSSLAQVKSNVESQRRQRALVQRARGLGWAHERIVVVDDDLGRSGTRADNRDGYQRIADGVCEDQGGIVFAVEASRLARNDEDWHHLLELCSKLGVLVGDEQRVYDPAHRDDRALLGIQGTLAVYELSLFRERAQAGILQKARRGALYSCLAVGYVITEDGGLDQHPDARVRQALELFFTQFRRLRSARQVFAWLREHEINLPYLPAPGKPEQVEWAVPTYPRVLSLLHNPIYAGAYVYGRTRTDVVVDADHQLRKRRGRRVPRSEWTVLHHDHHPGYITWSEYEANEKHLAENANMNGHLVPRAVQQGEALLTGLLWCRECGRKLGVRYSGRRARYVCDGPADQRHRSGCSRVTAGEVDSGVAAQILEAVKPAGVRAAIRAQELLAQEHTQRRDAARLEVEQAQYEAERAHRQYSQVEPENRLVAGELERRWEEKLRVVSQAQAQLAAIEESILPAPADQLPELRELGRQFDRVWSDPAADMKLKKRLVRTVIEQILVRVDDERQVVELLIHWSGGCHTELSLSRASRRRRVAQADLVQAVRTLRQVLDDEALARALNRAGIHTLQGNTWTAARVGGFRRRHGIAVFRARDKAEQGWLLQSEAANRVGLSAMSVHRLIERGILAAQQPAVGLPCIIRESDLAEPAVQRAIQAMKQARPRPLTDSPNQQVLF